MSLKIRNLFQTQDVTTNNLNANYKRILEVLRKISKEQLLSYQGRKLKMSDLELVSLSLTAEYLGINSENDLFRKLPKHISSKVDRSVYNQRQRKFGLETKSRTDFLRPMLHI